MPISTGNHVYAIRTDVVSESFKDFGTNEWDLFGNG